MKVCNLPRSRDPARVRVVGRRAHVRYGRARALMAARPQLPVLPIAKYAEIPPELHWDGLV